MSDDKKEALGLGEVKYLYRVRLLREDKKDSSKQKIFEEFYVARKIEDVWEKIEDERLDEAVEVEGITREVPVLAILGGSLQ